jgi:hypothetical protein
MKMTIALSPQTEREPRAQWDDPKRRDWGKNQPPVPPTEPQPVPVDDPPETPNDPPPDVVRDPAEIGRASRLNRIARRAFQIYESRGGGHERALSDWLQAEREIDLTD